MKNDERTCILEKELGEIWKKIPAFKRLILKNVKEQVRVAVAVIDKDNADNLYCSTANLQDVSVRRWQSHSTGEKKDIITCTLSIIVHDDVKTIDFDLQEVDGKDRLEIKTDLNKVADKDKIDVEIRLL